MLLKNALFMNLLICVMAMPAFAENASSAASAEQMTPEKIRMKKEHLSHRHQPMTPEMKARHEAIMAKHAEMETKRKAWMKEHPQEAKRMHERRAQLKRNRAEHKKEQATDNAQQP